MLKFAYRQRQAATARETDKRWKSTPSPAAAVVRKEMGPVGLLKWKSRVLAARANCMPCASGEACLVFSDCRSEVCAGGVCAGGRCDDGIQNGLETDVDCGGEECEGCLGGAACNGPDDCLSTMCISGRCAEVSCDDRVQTPPETDVDCGGPLCPPCDAGRTCNEDCSSCRAG